MNNKGENNIPKVMAKIMKHFHRKGTKYNKHKTSY